jgi:hypothetical protein
MAGGDFGDAATLHCFFEYFSGFVRSKKVRKGFGLVWHTTMWLIWKSRNDVIFNNVVKNALDCVEDIHDDESNSR